MLYNNYSYINDEVIKMINYELLKLLVNNDIFADEYATHLQYIRLV